MKILRKGNPQEERLYRGDCRNCGCQIEFKQHEGKIVRDPRDGDYIQVNCPTCMTYITVAL